MAMGNVVRFGVNRVTKEPIALKEVDCGVVGLNDIWFRPSTDWNQGGPIIEREKIDCVFYHGEGEWIASLTAKYGGHIEGVGSGKTALIAAMRCFVASKLGEEVEIP